MTEQRKSYIGDGVYVIEDEYEPGGVWLYANDVEHPTDRVYLEPMVLMTLIQSLKHWGLIK